MSWSFHAIGDARSFPAALDAHAASLTGDSKIEFEQVKPHLAGLIAQNVNGNGPCVLKLSASGHASRSGGAVEHSDCAVSLERLHGSQVLMPTVAAAPTQAAAAPTESPPATTSP